MCFGFEWLLHVLIVLIIVCVVVTVLRIWIFPMLGTVDPRIPATINVIIWAVVAIFVLVVCFDLLMCAMGSSMWLRR